MLFYTLRKNKHKKMKDEIINEHEYQLQESKDVDRDIENSNLKQLNKTL